METSNDQQKKDYTDMPKKGRPAGGKNKVNLQAIMSQIMQANARLEVLEASMEKILRILEAAVEDSAEPPTAGYLCDPFKMEGCD